jgi:uncharacterized membrane protein YeiH
MNINAFIVILDWFGIAVFAVTGALVASRKQMDIFGFMLLGTATGIGGGSIRDVMLGVLPVFWVSQPVYLAICLGVAAVTFFVAHIPESRYRMLLWLDAVGLSFVCVVGADRALASGTNAFIAVTMGVVTAAFGGMVRDILGGEPSILLRKEIYVTAAAAGAAVYVGLVGLPVSQPAAAVAGFATCFVIRALALHNGWSLPVYRPRPGRTAQENEEFVRGPDKRQ